MRYLTMRKLLIAVVSYLVLYSASANVFAGNEHVHEHEHEHEHRQHGVHVHGEAKLNILIDTTTISFELESPAKNVLGFEHEPKTEEERMKAEEAARLFKSYSGVLSLSGVKCEQAYADIELPFNNEEGHAHHGKDHHDGKHENADEHSEYHLSYSLKCEDTSKLDIIDVNLFSHFPGFEQVEAKWISETNSGVMVLTPTNISIAFE